MRPSEEVRLVQRLAAEGRGKAEIVRTTGIPYRMISHWLNGRAPNFDRRPAKCTVCSGEPLTVPVPEYVYRLAIFCADDYPQIMQECQDAMAAVLPNGVGRAQKRGCTEVYSYSKHWPCLFRSMGRA